MVTVYYKVFYPNPADPDFIKEVMKKHNIRDLDDAAWAARDEYMKKVVELRAFLRNYKGGGVGAVRLERYKDELVATVGVGGLLASDNSAEYFSFVPGGTLLSSQIRGESQVEQLILGFEGELAKRGFKFKQFDLLACLKDV